VSEHRLVKAEHLLAEIHGADALGRFNGWLAVRAAGLLGNMWFFWFCVALDAAELVLGNPATWSAVTWVTFLSQTVIQLLALPLLGAGQRILSAAQDARAETDHQTLTAIHDLAQHIDGLQDTQLEILKKLGGN
jgi:hypothetical protein